MKQLKTYLEELATSANTMGMGNPGEIGPDTLTEPIGGVEKTAKAIKQDERKKKKKKIKSLSESLFDVDLTTSNMTFGSMFKLEDILINEEIKTPDPRFLRTMIVSKFKISDLYKTTLLSKDAGIKVTKNSNSIANALNKIICDIELTPELLKMSLYNFSKRLAGNTRKYYSSTLLHNTYFNMAADVYILADSGDDTLIINADELTIKFFHITLIYKRK